MCLNILGLHLLKISYNLLKITNLVDILIILNWWNFSAVIGHTNQNLVVMKNKTVKQNKPRKDIIDHHPGIHLPALKMLVA